MMIHVKTLNQIQIVPAKSNCLISATVKISTGREEYSGKLAQANLQWPMLC